MPLSGVFFVSLHHQSNRMTMFKKTDPNPQLDIFTAPSMQLGSRASKKYSRGYVSLEGGIRLQR